ncbi:MAG: tetratricopeptide repeat protein [Planctomycetes bacterium]|nr:tetratricopeptide repeat protein [Planctomycetota bacterium]
MRLVIFACVVAAAPGCAGHRVFQSAEEPDRDRRARQEAAVRHFEEQRDQAQLHSAMNDWQQGNVSRCRRSLQLIIARNPEHRQARLLLAELHLYEHQPEQALDILLADGAGDQEGGLEADEQDAAWQHTLGLAYEALGDGAQACDCYRRAAELQPDNDLFAWSYEAAIDEIDAIDNIGERDLADSPESIVESAEDNTAHPAREPRRLPLGTRRVSALPAPNPVQPAIHEQPVLSDVANVSDVQTIVALIEVTDPEETSSAALAETTPDEAIAQAVAALGKGQPTQAAEICQAALREHADCPALYRILGVAEYRQSNYAASQSALWQALSLDNSSGLSYFLMGCTLARLGQQAAADRHLAQARALDSRF